MSKQPRRRGRPKGTGIKDDATLAMIGKLLAADPLLKPTTAIHRAGITDPSVVRRLRDKLKVAQPSLPVASRRPRTQGRASITKQAREKTQIRPATRSAAAAATNPVEAQIRSSIVGSPLDPPFVAPAAPSVDAAPSEANAPDPQLEALRLAAEAAAAMSRLYLHCMTYASQTNPMMLALRGQTVMSQWLSSMMLPPMKLTNGLKSGPDQ